MLLFKTVTMGPTWLHNTGTGCSLSIVKYTVSEIKKEKLKCWWSVSCSSYVTLNHSYKNQSNQDPYTSLDTITCRSIAPESITDIAGISTDASTEYYTFYSNPVNSGIISIIEATSEKSRSISKIIGYTLKPTKFLQKFVAFRAVLMSKNIS